MDNEWKWQQENAAQQLRIIELEKVLTFYSDKSNYAFGGYTGVRRMIKIETDRGEMARNILEESRSEAERISENK